MEKLPVCHLTALLEWPEKVKSVKSDKMVCGLFSMNYITSSLKTMFCSRVLFRFI